MDCYQRSLIVIKMSYSNISFSSGNWAGEGRVLKFHSETTTHVNFALTTSDGSTYAFASNPLEGGLAVEKSSNTWSDLDTSNGNFPAISSQSTTSVTLANQFGAVRAVFSKPAQSTWNSTNSESVVTIDAAVGSLVDYPSFSEITVSITSGSPGGSDFVYKVKKDNVLISDTNTHVNGSPTSYDEDYSTVGRFGVWDLTVRQLSTSTIRHLDRLTITDPSLVKKVFCNFW